jgi:tripeptidyl-peptidase I
MGWKSLSLLGLLAFSTASPAPIKHVVHEKRDRLPSRWTKRGRAQGTLPMRIGLVQSNLDKAHDYLMDLSHPGSANYGQHWTSEQVIDAFKPSDDTVDTVKQWLADAGIKGVVQSDNKAWLAFHPTVAQAEELLQTEYFEYEDRQSGGIMPGCDQYHVPMHIQQHIDYITPGIKLMAPHTDPPTSGNLKKRQGWPHRPQWHHRPHGPKHHYPPGPPPYSNSSDLSTCDVAITPACVAALYHIPPGHSAHPGNSMGIFEAELQFWDQEDLNLFFTNFTHWIPNGTHPIDRNIDGGVASTTNISEAGGEAMLDLELAYPIVYPQTITVWNVDDLHYQTWANDTYTWGFNTLLDGK